MSCMFRYTECISVLVSCWMLRAPNHRVRNGSGGKGWQRQYKYPHLKYKEININRSRKYRKIITKSDAKSQTFTLKVGQEENICASLLIEPHSHRNISFEKSSYNICIKTKCHYFVPNHRWKKLFNFLADIEKMMRDLRTMKPTYQVLQGKIIVAN